MREAIFGLSLALSVAFGGARGQEETEEARLGQVTLKVRSILTFDAKRNGTYVDPSVGLIRERNETSDRITYTYTETQRLNVTQIEDRMLLFGSQPETEKTRATLTIEGGGQESGLRTADGALVFRVNGSWTYKAPPLPEDFGELSVYEIVLGGHFKVGPPGPLPAAPEVTCDGTVVSPADGSFPFKTLGLASGLAPILMNRALDDPGFVQQFEGTTPNNEAGFHFSREAHFSASGSEPDDNRPGITTNWTGRWDVQYTLGYAAETELEAVIVPPEDYQTWMPTGGTDEDTPSLAPVVVRAELRLKDQPGRRPSETAKFRFELIDTSREPGLCLNAPSKDKAKDSYDLTLRQEENPELEISDNGQTAISREASTSHHAVIGSYDWGAYARLRVTAVLENGNELAAHLAGNSEREDMAIPLDENNNRVADTWEKKKSVFDRNLPANWDGAQDPNGQKAPGDGISLYEKYRGFEFEGIHERLDPNHKYLFVHDPDEIVRRINSEGRQDVFTAYGYTATNEVARATRFSAVSQLRLRYVDGDHWTGSGSSREKKRIVNFNTGWKDGHAVDQHALDVEVDMTSSHEFPAGFQEARARAGKAPLPSAPFEQGFAYPDIDYRLGSPTHTYRIVISVSLIVADLLLDALPAISRVIGGEDGSVVEDDSAVATRAKEYVAAHAREFAERVVKQEALVVAHEMSHGVGIPHHEDESGRDACVMTRIKPEAKGGPEDPFGLVTLKPWPHELCRVECWHQVIVSDLADRRAGG